MNRKVTPPVGNQLSCKNWQIEAAYRMIQHNLDQNVAENPDELIVLYHKLRLLKKLNRVEESNEICKKILSIYPSNIEVQNEFIK